MTINERIIGAALLGSCDEGIRDWMPERLLRAYDEQIIARDKHVR